MSLAENLGLVVIAEGVESEEQLEALRQEQCQFVQGYYLSRPLQQEMMAWFIDKLSKLNDRRLLAEFVFKRSD
jgi:EAL domain-containing protein (putative c-di-GMP-specific phosphodiesterase class I)